MGRLKGRSLRPGPGRAGCLAGARRAGGAGLRRPSGLPAEIVRCALHGSESGKRPPPQLGQRRRREANEGQNLAGAPGFTGQGLRPVLPLRLCRQGFPYHEQIAPAGEGRILQEAQQVAAFRNAQGVKHNQGANMDTRRQGLGQRADAMQRRSTGGTAASASGHANKARLVPRLGLLVPLRTRTRRKGTEAWLVLCRRSLRFMGACASKVKRAVDLGHCPRCRRAYAVSASRAGENLAYFAGARRRLDGVPAPDVCARGSASRRAQSRRDFQLRGDLAFQHLQGGGQAAGFLPAGLRQILTPAAAAADAGRRVPYQRAGMQA